MVDPHLGRVLTCYLSDHELLMLASALYVPTRLTRVPKPVSINGEPYIVVGAREGFAVWFDRVLMRLASPTPPGVKVLVAGTQGRAPVWAYIRPIFVAAELRN